ncbi:MAG: HNH endonuclease, partial [Anaerolineales bacterium]|nr:HNH endonuclease [Anaerolineales bacterium]
MKLTTATVETNGHSKKPLEHLTTDKPVIKIPTQIVKRDGRIVPFDTERIQKAMDKCFQSIRITPKTPTSELAHQAVNVVAAKYDLPTVEGVQDIVEMVLQAAGEYEAAKSYILYRAEHAKMREIRPVPPEVKAAFAESDQYFPTQLQKFQFYDKYSRFNYELGRRETWLETVTRAVNFLREISEDKLPAEDYERLRQGILEMKVMPSMRLLAMAGPAARRNNIAIYNCSYLPVDSIDSFVEALIISMSGCGVGYSVERQYVEQMPRIQRQSGEKRPRYVIEDTSEGWAEAVRHGLETWFAGEDVEFDYSEVRPAGAPLRTKGGRASGPEPLRKMLNFARERILARQGGFMTTLDAHDIMCAVGSAAVSGGVRRTAMISLFDYDDNEMRHCKDGDFWHSNSQRWNANNSAVWPNRELSQQEVTRFVLDMVESGRGEPGIFNRRAAVANQPMRRIPADFGTNPCVTGETLVAVADGRGRVTMRELVEDGKDVDVFTVKDGELVIRTMRHPRKTGTQSPVYRVTFADGTHMRVTPNHKFVLKDGTVKQAIELAPNDALTSLKVYAYRKQGLPQTEKVPYGDEKSYRMLQFGHYRKSEHRFIYQHHTGERIDGNDYHIHHLDFDGRNNSLDNLELVTAQEHAHIHRERMIGENNPVHNMTDEWREALSEATTGLANGNAKAVTNEALHQIIANYILALGYVPTLKQYQQFAKENDLPMTFSSYRQAYFGGSVLEALYKIAAENGLEITAREAKLREKTDLPIKFIDNEAYVIKHCEVCGDPFEVRFNRREQACCSRSCATTLQHTQRESSEWGSLIQEARTRNHDDVRTLQIAVYNDLMYELGRHPLKVEWQARCRAEGISPEVSRVSSPFRYWQDLQEAATAENHRVTCVEFDGYEDVYTGTVDDTHTYFAIGQEAVDTKGRTEMRYVLNVQCGEIILRPMQFCNLTSAVARAEDT